MYFSFWGRQPAAGYRSAFAISAVLLATIVLTPIDLGPGATAKTPGKQYCFLRTCHRVLTLAQTRAQIGLRKSLIASYYSDCRSDRYNPCGLTSSGAVFKPGRDDNAASPIYPNGTKLLVWNPSNRRAAVIRIDNAGPYSGNRTLDLSRAAARKLGFIHRGVARLQVQVLTAPTRREATYRRHRVYPKVPGFIGKFPSLASAANRAADGGTRLAKIPLPARASASAVVAAATITLPIPRPVAVEMAALPTQPPVPEQRLLQKPVTTDTRLQVAMRELPTENLPAEPLSTSSIRLPVQLVRAASPEPTSRRRARRQRIAALERREDRSRRTAETEKRAAPRARKRTVTARKLPASRQANVVEKEKPEKVAQQPRKAADEPPRKTSSSESRPDDRRVIQAPTAAPAPTPVGQPRLAWRQKYFAMNRGGT